MCRHITQGNLRLRKLMLTITFLAANKGIGYGIAKLLAEQGLTTVVAARNG